MDCLFCKINEELIPSKTLYEDNIVRVFMDIHPISDGHLLIIPKKHVEDFMAIDGETISHIYEIAKKMKDYIYLTLDPVGLKLVSNYGTAQEIKHFHLHLIPIYKNQEFTQSLDVIYDKINKQINLSNLMN